MNVGLKIKIDDLNEEWYSFWLEDRTNKLRLDTYHKVARKTKRHKFQPATKVYSRLGRPPHPCETNRLSLDEVPFTYEIKKLAFDTFIEQIEVTV